MTVGALAKLKRKRCAKDVLVPINEKEDAMLESMLGSDQTGAENNAEFFRLLLYREYNRRHDLGPPKASDWQSEFRNGRPSSK